MASNNIIATRESLVAEIEHRVEDKILERTNADLLIKLIQNADSLTEAISIAQLGTTYKRTGLHYDKRIEKFGNTIKYFKKNVELSFSDGKGGNPHKLIIGDNFDALQNLLIQYRGTIDVIYIDPPYGKDSMGEFAKTNYNNALTRDNLLSMLHPRLELAKQLLSTEGVIFCSIDDKNYAYLKCLCDDVFNESGYIATYLWKKTDTPPSLSNKVRKKYEYVLCYGNKVPKAYKFTQGSIDGGDAPLLNAGNPLGVLKFPAGKVHFNIPDGIYHNSNDKKIRLLDDVKVENGENKNAFSAEAHWKWCQDNLETEVKSGTYFLIKSTKFSPRYQKSQQSLKVPQNNIDSTLGVGTNEDGSNMLESIISGGLFDNPKPISLIKFLINMTNKDDEITVLDFFAGSGTTLHSVLDLNNDDDGHRFCILCTSNETTDTTPNGIVYDVTAKRLKRIMAGECYDGTRNFAWAKDHEPYGGSLDVYEIEGVSNSEHVCGKTPFDVIDETLYGKEKFAELKDKIQWVCENFEATQRKIESDSDWKKRQEE